MDRQRRIVHKDFWRNQLAEVVDEGDSRSLYLDSDNLQSRMSISRPANLVLTYTWYMLLPLLYLGKLRRLLIIGVGAGSFIRFFHHHFPDLEIDAVDISEHVLRLAQSYFLLPAESRRLRLHCQDGAAFLRAPGTERSYDLILLDAFDGQGMAAEIYSRQVFTLCSQALAPGGSLSCNLWSGKPTRLKAIRHELTSCFAATLDLPVPDRGNIVVIAQNKPVDWRRITRRSKDLRTLSSRFELPFHLLVKVACNHNLSLIERLRLFLGETG